MCMCDKKYIDIFVLDPDVGGVLDKMKMIAVVFINANNKVDVRTIFFLMSENRFGSGQ